MTNSDFTDPILRGVGRLPVLMPNEQRAERLRARCRARLAPPPAKKNGQFAPVLLAGWSLLYLTAIALNALRLRGLF